MRCLAIATPPPYHVGQTVDIIHDGRPLIPAKGTILIDQEITILVSIEDRDDEGKPLSVFDGRKFWMTEWEGVYEWQGNVWKIGSD